MGVVIEPIYQSIGYQVHRLRVEARLSQEELGRRLEPKLTRGSITNIETGKQRVLVHTLVSLANALGVELDELVGVNTVKPAAQKSPPKSRVQRKKAAADYLTPDLQESLQCSRAEAAQIAALIIPDEPTS